MKQWRAENKRKARDYQLRLKFGISLAQYDEMLETQHGLCAICSNAPGKFGLAVDHNHETNEVRGLLCSQCNVALERLEAVSNWTELAIAYLAKTAL